jgi:hypothetical protein
MTAHKSLSVSTGAPIDAVILDKDGLSPGMVHVYVGQKLLKNHKIRVFLMSDNEYLTLHLKIQTQYKATRPYVILPH